VAHFDNSTAQGRLCLFREGLELEFCHDQEHGGTEITFSRAREPIDMLEF
jgi:hypothetical protein